MVCSGSAGRMKRGGVSEFVASQEWCVSMGGMPIRPSVGQGGMGGRGWGEGKATPLRCWLGGRDRRFGDDWMGGRGWWGRRCRYSHGSCVGDASAPRDSGGASLSRTQEGQSSVRWCSLLSLSHAHTKRRGFNAAVCAAASPETAVNGRWERYRWGGGVSLAP